MRPDIKRMNERLDYFLHEMDLANAHVDHAEREIERLEKKLADQDSELKIYKRAMLYVGDREAYELTIEQLKQENTQLKEENYWLKQSVETENDRLERNEELTKENARLIKVVNQLKEDVNIKNINIEKLESQIGALGVTIKWKQDQVDALKKPLEEAHYCNCGAPAYIHYMINDGKYYCGHCFKKEVIKL